MRTHGLACHWLQFPQSEILRRKWFGRQKVHPPMPLARQEVLTQSRRRLSSVDAMWAALPTTCVRYCCALMCSEDSWMTTHQSSCEHAGPPASFSNAWRTQLQLSVYCCHISTAPASGQRCQLGSPRPLSPPPCENRSATSSENSFLKTGLKIGLKIGLKTVSEALKMGLKSCLKTSLKTVSEGLKMGLKTCLKTGLNFGLNFCNKENK